MRCRPTIASGLQENLPKFPANGMRERDMRHNTAPKEGVIGRLFGAVEKLVNDDNVARLIFLLQRPNGANADDPLNTELFHGPDIRAMVQFARQNPMAAPVSREKDDVAPAQFSGEQIVRRFPEGRFDLYPFLVREAFYAVKSGAADDSNFVFRHGNFLTFSRLTQKE
jgi:hypothetical protein